MKIKTLEINNIGGIENIQIDFDKNMNFICGPNGIGKTTLLECIAHSDPCCQIRRTKLGRF